LNQYIFFLVINLGESPSKNYSNNSIFNSKFQAEDGKETEKESGIDFISFFKNNHIYGRI